MRPSIRFLMFMGFGWKRLASWRVTSLMRSLCVMCFLSFMIRTMHAYSKDDLSNAGLEAEDTTHLCLMFPLLVNAVLRLPALLRALHARRDSADLDLLQIC